MTHSLTIDLPQEIFQRLIIRARRSNRSVQAEALDVIATAMDEESGLSPDLEAELAAMTGADDGRLWELARSRLPDKHITEIENLRLKSRAGGLTPAEEERLDRLVQETDRVMLVRAEAAALLHQRGYNVQSLLGRR